MRFLRTQLKGKSKSLAQRSWRRALRSNLLMDSATAAAAGAGDVFPDRRFFTHGTISTADFYSHWCVGTYSCGCCTLRGRLWHDSHPSLTSLHVWRLCRPVLGSGAFGVATKVKFISGRKTLVGRAYATGSTRLQCVASRPTRLVSVHMHGNITHPLCFVACAGLLTATATLR